MRILGRIFQFGQGCLYPPPPKNTVKKLGDLGIARIFSSFFFPLLKNDKVWFFPTWKNWSMSLLQVSSDPWDPMMAATMNRKARTALSAQSVVPSCHGSLAPADVKHQRGEIFFGYAIFVGSLKFREFYIKCQQLWRYLVLVDKYMNIFQVFPILMFSHDFHFASRCVIQEIQLEACAAAPRGHGVLAWCWVATCDLCIGWNSNPPVAFNVLCSWFRS